MAGYSPPLQGGPGGPGDLGQDSVQVHRLGLLLHHVLRHEICRPRERSGGVTLTTGLSDTLTPALGPSHWCWMKQ